VSDLATLLQMPSVIFMNSHTAVYIKNHTLLTVTSTQTHALLLQLACPPCTITSCKHFIHYVYYRQQNAIRKIWQFTNRTNL